MSMLLMAVVALSLDGWKGETVSFRFDRTGDTFLAYPNGDPSWRYLNLLNGNQNGEKWRILASAGGETAAALERLGKRYDVRMALNKRDGDFCDLVADTLDR